MKDGWVSDGHNDLAFSVGAVRRFAGLFVDRFWRCVFRLAHVTALERVGSMSDRNGLVRQMVMEIAGRAWQLDDSRLRLFLDWLSVHSAEMKVFMENREITAFREVDPQERFRSALRTWLESLPARDQLWEYRTLTAEIDWCRDLDSTTLRRLSCGEAR